MIIYLFFGIFNPKGYYTQQADKPIAAISLEGCTLYKNNYKARPLINWRLSFEIHCGERGKIFIVCCQVNI